MAAKTFEDIMKFNPYHDSRGRFASANTATSFTYRTKDPDKQHLADRAREREKEREAAAEGSGAKAETPQMKTLHDIEDRIRHQDFESAAVVNPDGEVMFFKDGQKSQVSFTGLEGRMMLDNILTHNHPSSSMFSVEDLDCFTRNNMQGIRATTREGITYSIERGENYLPSLARNFPAAYNIHRNEVMRNAQKDMDDRGFQWKIAKGEVTRDEANAEFRGLINRGMIDYCEKAAPNYGLSFTVDKREVTKSAGTTAYTAKAADDSEIVITLDKETEDIIEAAFNEWFDSIPKEAPAETKKSDRYDYIVEVEKFNPYHDARGRFATAGAATSFTYAPGKSKAHDKAIERHKERMASIAPTAAQDKALRAIESRTRNLKNEQFRVVDREGNVIMNIQGEKDCVIYTIGEAREKFPGNVTIHNHPEGGTFSTADLSNIGYGATEIRAAAPEGTYILRNLSHGSKWTEGQKSWMDMRNDLDTAIEGFKSSREMKKEIRKPFDALVQPIADRWAARREAGASQEELNKIAREYDAKLAEIKPQLDKAVRAAYVGQYDSWYKANAGKYGFEYIFNPVRGRTRKSDTMEEFDNIEKSSGEIVLDRQMNEDVQEIVNDILSEYSLEKNQEDTKKSSTNKSVLFIGLKINGADHLAIDGGEDPEEFHVTLAYGHFDRQNLGDEDDIDVRVQHAIDDIRDLIPDDIHFDAISRFTASNSSDGKDVIYARVAAGQLEDAHDELLKALKKRGIKLEDTFPTYKPHMTLAYIDPGQEYELSKIDASGTATKVMIGHGQESSQENNYTIMKTDDDKRLVFGWASISIKVDGQQLEDRQQDIIDPEDLEEAAYEYVLNFRDTGEEHIQSLRKKGKLVESCVFTAEKQQAMGIPAGIVPVGWWIGFKIEDDDAWEKVKNGTYKMFSIEGRANREPV